MVDYDPSIKPKFSKQSQYHPLNPLNSLANPFTNHLTPTKKQQPHPHNYKIPIEAVNCSPKIASSLNCSISTSSMFALFANKPSKLICPQFCNFTSTAASFQPKTSISSAETANGSTLYNFQLILVNSTYYWNIQPTHNIFLEFTEARRTKQASTNLKVC